MTVQVAMVRVPLHVRLQLSRAAVQVTADRAAVDLLHIKGGAVDRSLRPTITPGSDVDVLVRPAHIAALHRALISTGWRVYSTFEGGSPFGHAQTYQHETWGYLDLHRYFPGIGLESGAAFEHLWAAHGAREFAGVVCPVPALPAQAVILVLNAARARTRRGDLRLTWDEATPEFRRRVLIEVEALDASIAFDAAFGRLDAHRGAQSYQLWKVVTTGGDRVEEWSARIRAAPTLAARLRLFARAPLVNVETLSHRLGRPASPADIAREFVGRSLRGIREVGRRVTRRFTR